MSLYQIIIGNLNNNPPPPSTYISYNTASTWNNITQTPSEAWTINGSTNGKVLAIGSNNIIHISTDSGTSWTQIVLRIGVGTSVAVSSSMSGDGTKLIVFLTDNGIGIFLYTYNGTTWIRQEITPPGSSNWRCCTMSTNGGVFYVGTSISDTNATGRIYKSIDGGSSWTSDSTFSGVDPAPSLYQWASLATNSDGTKVLAANNSGYLYLSNDSAATFVAQVSLDPGAGNWQSKCLDMTPDGLKLIVCAINRYVWISIDGGVEWTRQNQPVMGSKQWGSVSCSNDFKVLGATHYGGYVYLSTDSGSTWTQQTDRGSSSWYSILISAISGICFRETTRVLMSDRTFKAIKDIQRGDEILTDKKTGATKKVARTLNFMATGKATEIPMHLIGNRRSIVCSSTHPFWVSDTRRILAGDIEGTKTIQICEWLYTIQFEDEATYYVEGVKVDAVSPDHRKFKLPKELYFDQTKYKANRVMKSEDDERRKKPNMTKIL